MKDSIKESIEKFREVLADPATYARSWKAATGGKVVGSFCSYTPVEILYAGNALSYRVLSANTEYTLADIHLQAYCCSLVRGILDDALGGRLDFLDGAVFPHTCDSMQRLSDIWRMNTDFAFHEDLVLPVKLNSLHARNYIVQVMDTFRKNMGTHLGVDISEEKLHLAIRKVNRIRDALKTLDKFRMISPDIIKSSDVYTAVYAAMIMDPDEWLATGTALVTTVKEAAAEASAVSRKAVILSGGGCGSNNIHQLVEKNGGVVVHDDMCTGARFFEGIVEEHSKSSIALTQRYLQRTNCPAKHSGFYTRGDHLVNTARVKKADGVIFLLLKFCDPHAFDYPYLKKMLGDAGIPSLLVEVEHQSALGEAVTNRVEAFMEML